MSAQHFLDDPFIVQDAITEGVSHELELYELGGELFMHLWIGGSGANMPVICQLTKEQARQLSDGADRLAARLPG